MANRSLAEKLTRRGCQLVEAKAVASMKRMLRLPRQPQAADWARLGKALLAEMVVAGALNASPAGVQIELVSCVVSSGQAVNRSSTVPAADALSTLLRLADEVLPPPPPTSVPASAPASQPTPTPTPTPVVRRPPPRPPPSRRGEISPPPAAPAPAPRLTARPPSKGPFFLAATGVRLFHFFDTHRTGPALDVEVGSLGQYFRWGFFFRSFFGDNTGYMIGGRFDVGPRIGPLRLTFGAGLGLLGVPNVGETLDLMVFNLHLVGAVLQLGHVALLLDAFTLDFNVIPGDVQANRDPELMLGFSSGLTVGVFF
jgi:hypothetical protein